MLKAVDVISTIVIILALFFIALRFNKILAMVVVLAGILYLIFKLKPKITGIKANLAIKTGDTDKAIALFQKIYETDKMPIKEKISYSYLLLREGQLDDCNKVLKELKKVQKMSTEDEMLFKQVVALTYWKKGMLDEGIKELEEVFEVYQNTTVYGNLGYFKILSGDLEDALSFNLKAYEYNNEDKIILDNLGLNYYLLNKYEEAQEIYIKLLNLKPHFPEAYYNYGKVLKELGKNDEAIKMFKEALEKEFIFLGNINKEQVEEEIRNAEA